MRLEVELGFGLAILMLSSGSGRFRPRRLQRVRVHGRNDLDVADGQDADHGVAFALVPVGVHLPTDVDQVTLLET